LVLLKHFENWKTQAQFGHVVQPINPSYSEGGGSRIAVPSHSGQSSKFYLKIKPKAKGLRAFLRGKALA
jgi:hypothetical protein